jgi:glycosyltransferase involved in cell wall biosynthesis
MSVDTKKVILSVIVTAHSEGILAHRTLSSVRRALAQFPVTQATEIILHVDNPTPETLEYLKVHKNSTLKDVRVFENSFGDLGSSRNYAVLQAKGKYVATIDADDLMSKNWLIDAVQHLEKTTEPTVAHSEVTVEFEGADSLIVKHGEIDRATDTLLSVYANRWNSVIVAPRSLLLEEPYTPNSPGFGYEDWNLNCRLIARDVHNVLIPHTAIFVRRKRSNSEWARQIQSMAVLRANPLLALSAVRSIENPFAEYTPSISPVLRPRNLRSYAISAVKRYPLAYKAASRVQRSLKRQVVNLQQSVLIPDWLQKEARHLHDIEREIFFSHHLLHHIPVYDTISLDHKKAGSLYKTIVDTLEHNHYDYVIFAPWIIKGGADRYTINYANTIAERRPDKRILVIATLPVESVWREELADSVDFLPFGSITHEVSAEIKHRLMEHLIENAGVTHIHIINSEFGYDFVRLHSSYIRATNKKIIVTSFSQSVDVTGRVFGYSHTHVPVVYDQVSLITSDNQAVENMWEQDYGFDPKKMVVHRQPIDLQTTPLRQKSVGNQPLRVLWAARIAPEKTPQLVKQIGEILGSKVQIDMYGSIDPECAEAVQNLPANVCYKGSFDGPTSLPTEKYDALLYTSLFDGMPNSLLEAIQAGLPIVASNVGGIPELIEDGVTGLLISNPTNPAEYATALGRLIDEPELGNKLTAGAYAKLQKEFSPKRYKQAVADMLKLLGY